MGPKDSKQPDVDYRSTIEIMDPGSVNIQSSHISGSVGYVTPKQQTSARKCRLQMSRQVKNPRFLGFPACPWQMKVKKRDPLYRTECESTHPGGERYPVGGRFFTPVTNLFFVYLGPISLQKKRPFHEPLFGGSSQLVSN